MKNSKYPIDILPKHVAIIMDGNGRWAKKYGKPRIFGHQNGVKAVREATEIAAELGVKYLTLYAFSTENWNRPAFEVNALMGLLVDAIKKEIQNLNKNNVRLQTIGDLSKLPAKSRNSLLDGIQKTKNNNGLTLILALNYSAKWEIVKTTKSIADKVQQGQLSIDEIDENYFANELTTGGIPDPEVLIRTSGEHRISNFLLWQIAYSELFFLDIFWPDFTKEHFLEVMMAFQKIERRFGKTSEQLKKNGDS